MATQSEQQNIIALSFCAGFKKLLDGAYEVIDGARETTLSPTTEDGVIVYFEELGKLGFQATGQYKRPNDFLQTLLDMVRVAYEPSVLGTFFLNSNMQFVFDEINSNKFCLGYGSLVSRDDQSFEDFYKKNFLPYLHSCGYDASQALALFVVVTTGEDRYGFDLVSDVSSVLNSGFSVNEALGLIASSIDEAIDKPKKTAYAGYCLDSALGSRLRCSAWILFG